MKNKLFAVVSVLVVALMLATLRAQSPAPVVAAPASAATATNSASMQATMKSLQALKEANEQILKKQEATLAALDELQKTADQIKIFSKRG